VRTASRSTCSGADQPGSTVGSPVSVAATSSIDSLHAATLSAVRTLSHVWYDDESAYTR
jgi:hypothetical protein